MTIQLITNFGHLLYLASMLGKAKKEGDTKKIKEAQGKHDEYQKLCLLADQVTI